MATKKTQTFIRETVRLRLGQRLGDWVPRTDEEWVIYRALTDAQNGVRPLRRRVRPTQ